MLFATQLFASVSQLLASLKGVSHRRLKPFRETLVREYICSGFVSLNCSLHCVKGGRAVLLVLLFLLQIMSLFIFLATLSEGILPENYSVAPFHLQSLPRDKGIALHETHLLMFCVMC